MATSSRQSGLFGVNDWKQIYQTFREADFRSYDYETLRKSFIDYLRLYYPETFNDYIESSEFIALLDVMAYMGQGLAFRNDLNSRENFIDTAERRDSVIKLANLVSYTPKRNLAAQGYLKVTSIQTTQNLLDINGVNLNNTPILWNDPANPNWLEQFNTIINATLVDTQRIGRPGNTAELLGITTNEYAIRIPDNSLPIAPFSSSVDGQNMNFELVSVTTLGEDYVYEIPPAPSTRFNILYRNDKLGFGSPETGFFFYFKQGNLQNFDFNLEQEISNQTVDISNIQGVNNTDTWLYQLNNNNGDRTLWRKVDNVYADAYLQTEFSDKKIFSVNSRFNDQVTYVFGDGVFSEVPVGAFRAYVRSSNAQTYVIEPSEMQGITVAFTYVNRQGRDEILTVGLELPLTVSNALAREPLAEIKQRAPTRYYTQNRMVNGEDYNNFPYTLYSSIIKSKAINRSSVGISKNFDLLDPTGKYSSTNSFGSDGALYQNENDGFLTLTINNISDIIAFFNNTLASALAENKANQYYIANSSTDPASWYKRFSVTSDIGNGTVYWQTSSVEASSETGYFYSILGSNNTPVSLGTFSTDTTKYVTTGAILKFVPPAGFYFDSNNRLVAGIAPNISQTYIWVTVLNVVGDGSNNNQGSFANGTGPVTLNGYVPSGVTLAQVIPVFDNSLSATLINECVIRMELQLPFTLVFNNSLTINEERWTIRPITDTNYFVKFESLPGANRYNVTYKALTYYFGSVADTRFTFSRNQLVYDPFTGKIIQDFINVLQINSQPPPSTQSLGKDIKVNILGQTVESDGYVNDFQVEIAATDVNNRQLILNPDFFEQVTGYQTNSANIGIYVFFREVQDAINLTRELIVPTTDVVFQFATKTQVEVVKYDYPLGQLFYAYSETNSEGLNNVFYKTVQDPTVIIPSYILVVQPEYFVRPGRQGLSFQYRHNSNNSTRIDPATTNIIDLYVVTQAYYTAYQNWIQDSTNTIPMPDMPTINQLNQEYSQVQDFKMLSDSVVLNSVVFKPLFGPKADPALRATIKVIKQSRTNASDSEIRSAVLTAMNEYFNVNNWNFGDTFFFSELSAYLHAECGELISSAVLVPNDPSKRFGDLYEIKCMPYEIFVNAAVANDVLVVAALTPAELQIR
jgi:hypothetical protein